MSPKSFKKNVLVWREKMLQVAYNTLRNQQDAEDVVQEVTLKLWITKDTLHTIKNTEAYLHTMVKNLCLDRIKLKKENVDIFESTLISSTTLEDDFSTNETTNVIALIIEKLPDLQKIIIKMHDVDGQTTKEIAKVTGSNVESIRMNLSRARKKVRDMYQNYLEHESK